MAHEVVYSRYADISFLHFVSYELQCESHVQAFKFQSIRLFQLTFPTI